jgi:RHS repeat-associated protein
MTYDEASGSMIQQIDPAEGGLPSETITYGFDTFGNPTGFGTPNDDYLASTIYDHLGRVAETVQGEHGSEVDISDTWDNGTGRLSEQLARRVVPTGAVISDHTYTYENSGLIAQDTDTNPNTGNSNQCYRYDYAQRLVAAWTAGSSCGIAPTNTNLGGPAAYWTSWAYSATGNRTEMINHASFAAGTDYRSDYAYPAAGATSVQPDALASVALATSPAGASTYTPQSTKSYGYSDAGDTTTRPGQVLTYDAGGHLATVTSAGSTQNRVYDADGDLLLTTDSTGFTAYLGDTQLHRAAGSSTVTGVRSYILGSTTYAERSSASTTPLYLVTNSEDTATATVTANTAMTLTRRYFDPFGNSRGTPPTWIDNHAFLNAPLDAASGLTHLGARDYDPSIGRFTTVDPLLSASNPQQVNGYSYADGNPVTLSDPTGMCPKDVCGSNITEPTAASEDNTSNYCDSSPDACWDGNGAGQSGGAQSSGVNYTSRHNQAEDAALIVIAAQIKAKNWSTAGLRQNFRIPGGGTGPTRVGIADIAYQDPEGYLDIWEVKAIGQRNRIRAQVDRYIAASDKARPGWNIGGPYPVGNGDDMEGWGGDGGILYFPGGTPVPAPKSVPVPAPEPGLAPLPPGQSYTAPEPAPAAGPPAPTPGPAPAGGGGFGIPAPNFSIPGVNPGEGIGGAILVGGMIGGMILLSPLGI